MEHKRPEIPSLGKASMTIKVSSDDSIRICPEVDAPLPLRSAFPTELADES
jgi:hypothetical protein